MDACNTRIELVLKNLKNVLLLSQTNNTHSVYKILMTVYNVKNMKLYAVHMEKAEEVFMTLFITGNRYKACEKVQKCSNCEA